MGRLFGIVGSGRPSQSVTLVEKLRKERQTAVAKVYFACDEHHDMMDEKKTPNIANLLCHAMQIWPEVRVHWLVEHADRLASNVAVRRYMGHTLHTIYLEFTSSTQMA